jgi:HEPN domain-containing protein
LTKQEHIEYWVTGSEDSWESALVLMNSNHYSMAAFCFHLSIEKLLKGIWVKNNESNFPPRIHNLITLHNGANLNLETDILAEFSSINSWNLEGRYTEYRTKMYLAINKQFLDSKIENLTKIKTCLLEILH